MAPRGKKAAEDTENKRSKKGSLMRGKKEMGIKKLHMG